MVIMIIGNMFSGNPHKTFEASTIPAPGWQGREQSFGEVKSEAAWEHCPLGQATTLCRLV